MAADTVDSSFQSEVKENGCHKTSVELAQHQSKPLNGFETLNVHVTQKENESNLVLDQEVKIKKKVNIYTEEPSETTALRKDSDASNSFADRSNTSAGTEKCLTMTGTVKRGKKAGQNLDVKLNISREELEMLDANIAAKSQQSVLTCGVSVGPHVTLWTLLCLPFVILVSSVYSFYMGTLMWYNVFTYVTEEVSIIWRILLPPILILFFPFFVVLCTIGLGVYAGLAQISWFFYTWQKEVTDLEKGFYGWLCSLIRMEDCSPYEVIILTDIQAPSHAPSQDTLTG